MQKILVVDDDRMNQEILNEILVDEGFKVLFAEDGIEAFDVLGQNGDVALILLDRMMPKMDGMRFMEQLNTHEIWKSIPVIMQTAAAAPEEVIEGAGSGVYYYLTKPYESDMVLSVVNAALERGAV